MFTYVTLSAYVLRHDGAALLRCQPMLHQHLIEVVFQCIPAVSRAIVGTVHFGIAGRGPAEVEIIVTH